MEPDFVLKDNTDESKTVSRQWWGNWNCSKDKTGEIQTVWETWDCFKRQQWGNNFFQRQYRGNWDCFKDSTGEVRQTEIASKTVLGKWDCFKKNIRETETASKTKLRKLILFQKQQWAIKIVSRQHWKRKLKVFQRQYWGNSDFFQKQTDTGSSEIVSKDCVNRLFQTQHCVNSDCFKITLGKHNFKGYSGKTEIVSKTTLGKLRLFQKQHLKNSNHFKDSIQEIQGVFTNSSNNNNSNNGYLPHITCTGPKHLHIL